MKLHDRMTGQQVLISELSGHILPGRYLLTERAYKSDCIVTGDGSGRIKLGEHSLACDENITDKDQETYKLICQALLQIEKVIDFDSAIFPSPLIPSRLLDDESKLSQLEELLEKVMGKGHLHEISRNPRFDMRYDETILPVSRAKRLANSAQRHLASHSECWQQRTFAGIHPRRVKGLVSEDEYHLYENRVYARLIDNLLRYLNRRLREIRDLINKVNEALNLENSDELVFLLRRKLYENWGETFSGKDANGYLELLNATESRLEALQRNIRSLTQGFLYKRIPRNAQIPGQIEQTNILSHDQHYRYLPPLWNELRSVTQTDNLSQEEQQELNQSLQVAYSKYTGMVIHRAFKQIGFQLDDCSFKKSTLSRTEHRITITESHLNWTIRDEFSGCVLTFVPIFSWNACECCEVRHGKNAITIPVSVRNDISTNHPVDYIIGNFQKFLPLSPLNFYSEEIMVSILNYWTLVNPVNTYGTEITKIPSSVMPILKESDAFRITSTHSAKMLSLPSSQEADKIIKKLKLENSKSCIQAVKNNIFTIKTLSQCPGCQSNGLFENRDNQTFKVTCKNNDCKLEWGVFYKDKNKIFEMTPRDIKKPEFTTSGRWFCHVPLNEANYT